MESIKANWMQWDDWVEDFAIDKIYIELDCPYCEETLDEYDLHLNNNRGEEINNTFICPHCKKDFILEIRSIEDV